MSQTSWTLSHLSSPSSQDAIVLRTILYIGHTHLTRLYLLYQKDQPQCPHSDDTDSNMLLKCYEYNSVRQMKELFDIFNAHDILCFIICPIAIA